MGQNRISALWSAAISRRGRRARRVSIVVASAVAMAFLPTPSPLPASAATGDPVLAAAGDIACAPGKSVTAKACNHKATSDLLLAMQPTVVATLGDNQYDVGSLSQFNSSFDPTWGRLKPLIRPAIGNHEIKADAKATGYFTYFGTAAGDKTKGYYSYDVGAWHVIVLNGNCNTGGGCGPGSAQEQWLRADLAARPAVCTLAYWHQPRFSSGNHGSNTKYDAFWKALYAAGADVVLNGHDHGYERFAPMAPSGARDDARGIREFVVGTGGSHAGSWPAVKANSQVRSSTFGVLKLTLGASSYDWKFVPVAGKTFTDSGTTSCH